MPPGDSLFPPGVFFWPDGLAQLVYLILTVWTDTFGGSPLNGFGEWILPNRSFLEVSMAFRRSMKRRASRKNFRRGSRVKRKNLRARPMRGGWRL